MQSGIREISASRSFLPEAWRDVCGMINSAHFCASVLLEWSERPAFLQIQLCGQLHHGQQEAASPSAPLFDPFVRSFQALVEAHSDAIVELIFGYFVQGSDRVRRCKPTAR